MVVAYCKWIRAVASFTASIFLTSTPAAAQDRLFMDGAEIGAHGRFGQPIGPANGLDHELAGGGRFLVPTPFSSETDIVDLRTGARRVLPAGATVTSVDPARPRLILALPGTGPTGTLDVAVYDIMTGATDVVVTGACPSGLIGSPTVVFAYAYDAQLAVVQRCATSQTATDLVAIDLSVTSHVPRVLPLIVPAGAALAISADARQLFVRTPNGFLRYTIASFDLATGTRLGAALTGEFMRWDDALDGLLVISGGGFADSQVSVFGRSMEPLGVAVLSSPVCRARVQISAHTGRIYLTRNGANNTGAEPAVVEAFAGAPLQLVARAIVAPLGSSSCAGAVVRTAPGPPRNLQAVVAGRDVTLDWTNVGGASNFVLEAGAGPGRTDVTAFLGPDSWATFTNVPPGVYYVRVHGGNEFGGGRPSQEIRVVVP